MHDYDPHAEHRETLLAHYIALASDPGWKRYAWERVKQLAAECPGLYGDFPERITEHFRKGAEQTSTD